MAEFDTPDVQSLFDKIKLFDKMYEIVRFVDPLKKKVIDYKGNGACKGGSSCFDFWDRGGICENCISMRAYNENQTFIKLEFNHKGMHIVTAVPVTLDDRRIVMELLKDATDSMAFGSSDSKKGSEVYSIIRNLNSMIFKDALTGVYNKRYIDERLPVDIINASVQNQEVSIILVDPDCFKNVNDAYGQIAGDRVLISIAKCIDDSIKKGCQWTARCGGEEFLVCLPNTGWEKAFHIAEGMRKSIEGMDILFEDKLIKITASFGVYSVGPDNYLSANEIVMCADKNLYKAKSLGKNRVAI